MKVFTWSDAPGGNVEQLKKLWENGLSASQIAAELGNVTRNAVIGKIHRLGLSGRAKSPSSAAPRQRKARPMRTTPFRPPAQEKAAPKIVPEVESEPDPVTYDSVVPMSQRLTLMQLNGTTCHWPIGDPQGSEFFFCGGKAMSCKVGPGQDASQMPYCAHHARIAYQPAVSGRRMARVVFSTAPSF